MASAQTARAIRNDYEILMSASFWITTLGSLTVLLMIGTQVREALPIMLTWWAVAILFLGMIDIWGKNGLE